MTGYIDYQYIDTIHFFLGQILLFNEIYIWLDNIYCYTAYQSFCFFTAVYTFLFNQRWYNLYLDSYSQILLMKKDICVVQLSSPCLFAWPLLMYTFNGDSLFFIIRAVRSVASSSTINTDLLKTFDTRMYTFHGSNF